MTDLERLVSLYKDLYEITSPECNKCKIPNSCCSVEYCIAAEDIALEQFGVDVRPKRMSSLGGESCKDYYLSPTGCVLEPHYRPMCTLHTCDIMSWGYKPNDEEWTKRYFEIRDSISEVEFNLFYKDSDDKIKDIDL